MFEITMSGLRANERRERIPQEITEYVRTEFRDCNPEWLVAKRENGH